VSVYTFLTDELLQTETEIDYRGDEIGSLEVTLIRIVMGAF